MHAVLCTATTTLLCVFAWPVLPEPLSALQSSAYMLLRELLPVHSHPPRLFAQQRTDYDTCSHQDVSVDAAQRQGRAYVAATTPRRTSSRMRSETGGWVISREQAVRYDAGFAVPP